MAPLDQFLSRVDLLNEEVVRVRVCLKALEPEIKIDGDLYLLCLKACMVGWLVLWLLGNRRLLDHPSHGYDLWKIHLQHLFLFLPQTSWVLVVKSSHEGVGLAIRILAESLEVPFEHVFYLK